MQFLKKELRLYLNILAYFCGRRKNWYQDKRGKFVTSPKRFYRGIADINGNKIPFTSVYYIGGK